MARGSRKTVETKEPLSAERIELAALELIEAEGLAAFSTRKLAFARLPLVACCFLSACRSVRAEPASLAAAAEVPPRAG